MRFSWTLNELHALRMALQDAEYFQADLQERMEENREDDPARVKASKQRQKNAEVLGSKVLVEILRRRAITQHKRKAGTK